MTETASAEEHTPDGLLGWCLVANVPRETAHGESGLDIQHGTKHFRAGTLLWLPPVRWDSGHGRRPAVGRHRGNSRRYVHMIVRADDLENFRVKGVYSEALVRSLNGYAHDPAAAPRTLQNPWSREQAQNWADHCNRHREPLFLEGHRYAHTRISVPNPPPAEIRIDGETFHLARYGTRGAHYSRTPPPVEWAPEQ
ncbi:hypothetical protein ACFYXS_06735 [Streptomyces sp. NPDC002574]|uniref:hypothetical protein n=1 Tax=Streptomyces sp. NPDC002574 TaxID=3364652 RepID=UPI0036B98113